ncbi:hypothetical protein F5Y12DRAFT_736344 [Xylaria sp. FL1777]|nr:hypothetical protein F5Y12DRAFT_736344 [Xylaria sp. FL1777]
MPLTSNQATNTAAEIVVETNNLHQVLQHFNSSGELNNKRTTRLSVECQICVCKNLALTNPQFDQQSDDSHEVYIVLSHCGHAFGFSCLLRWIRIQEHIEPKCPSCRTPMYCDKEHLPYGVFGSTNSDAKKQRLDITRIRALLQEGEHLQRGNAQPPNIQRPSPNGHNLAGNHEAFERFGLGHHMRLLEQIERNRHLGEEQVSRARRIDYEGDERIDILLASWRRERDRIAQEMQRRDRERDARLNAFLVSWRQEQRRNLEELERRNRERDARLNAFYESQEGGRRPSQNGGICNVM